MEVKERIVISVDGLAGSGKTALSRELAKRLGYVHLSSGMLYRAVGYLALKYGVDAHAGAKLAELIGKHSIRLVLGSDRSSRVLIDGDDLTDQLYEPRVSEATSQSASLIEVRRALIRDQHEAFPGENLVAEGRDMGTVVFPEAELKFFIEANVDMRVKRRISQLYGSVTNLSDDKLNTLKREIEVEVIERDRRDSERSLSPTIAAKDALRVDNSSKTLTEVVQYMYDSAASRGLIEHKL